MHRKNVLLLLPSFLLLSCAQGNEIDDVSSHESGSTSLQVDGGTHTFDAFSLPNVPNEKEEELQIDGHAFIFYNVYNDGQGNFVLKDNTSYIRNYSLIFGLRFAKGLSRAYDISGDKDGLTLCEDYYEGEDEQSYSVYHGFEIAIDKTLSSHHYDENIGKITHWC